MVEKHTSFSFLEQLGRKPTVFKPIYETDDTQPELSIPPEICHQADTFQLLKNKLFSANKKLINISKHLMKIDRGLQKSIENIINFQSESIVNIHERDLVFRTPNPCKYMSDNVNIWAGNIEIKDLR